MKIRILVAYAITYSFCIASSAQENKGFIITGQIKGLKEGERVKLFLRQDDLIGGQQDILFDSCFVKNNEFIFHGFIPDGPRLAALDFLVGRTKVEMQSPLFLMDNEKINIRGIIDSTRSLNQSIIIEGSRSYDEQKKLKPLFEIWRYSLREDLRRKLQLLKDSIGYNSDIMQGLELQNSLILSQVKRGILQNSSNQAAVPFFILECFDAIGYDSIVPLLFNRLDEHIKTSYYGNLVKVRLKLCEGNPAPDFNSKLTNGAILSLKEVVSKNKLTILDFWASSCAPCRNEIRSTIINLYNEFHSKGLEIIGVSCDQNETIWKKAISDDKQTWLNVSTLKGIAGDPVYTSYKIGRMRWLELHGHEILLG
jgi:thiol-disulfide isomerase/thioredoxin